jgi:5-formyltetrahydrofolate cyclo-ligase
MTTRRLDAKADLRREALRAARRDPEIRAMFSRRLVDEGFSARAAFRRARVSAFYPIRDEPDTLALLARSPRAASRPRCPSPARGAR